jgi:hypothetical protein
MYEKWPEWFREKYDKCIHFNYCLSSMHEGKFYSAGIYRSLLVDIQKCLQDVCPCENIWLAKLGEDGIISRYDITSSEILECYPKITEEGAYVYKGES